ncbi:MAG: lysine transporter LysE [Alphaproteobacteria bacterium]|nr:lysine transporter LysE [Alphaproteobacteria bacterium]
MFDQIDVLFRGIVLGVMVAAPVGPVGLLVIRRTVHSGILSGLATGIGAAAADTLFGAVAAFGIAAIISLLEGYQGPIRIVGGIVLIAMTWKLWRAHPHAPVGADGAAGALKAVLSGFMLTATNPVTVFAIMAVVTALGGRLGHADASTLTAGIMLGSLAWWFTLSGGIACVRHHFDEKTIAVINRGTAVLMAALAAWVLLGALLEAPLAGAVL